VIDAGGVPPWGRLGWVALALVFAVLAAAPKVQAEKRIALIIGNKDYKPGVGALVNPLNDIRIVGEALTAVGFEVLQPVRNAQRVEMLLAVHAFAAKLGAAGGHAVGFLYYSGHGMASAGENFLIPVDVEEPSTEQLSVHAVRHSEVLAILRHKAPNAAHYLVLYGARALGHHTSACRMAHWMFTDYALPEQHNKRSKSADVPEVTG